MASFQRLTEPRSLAEKTQRLWSGSEAFGTLLLLEKYLKLCFCCCFSCTFGGKWLLFVPKTTFTFSSFWSPETNSNERKINAIVFWSSPPCKDCRRLCILWMILSLFIYLLREIRGVYWWNAYWGTSSSLRVERRRVGVG